MSSNPTLHNMLKVAQHLEFSFSGIAQRQAQWWNEVEICIFIMVRNDEHMVNCGFGQNLITSDKEHYNQSVINYDDGASNKVTLIFFISIGNSLQ